MERAFLNPELKKKMAALPSKNAKKYLDVPVE